MFFDRPIVDVVLAIPEAARTGKNLKRFADAYSLMCLAGVAAGHEGFRMGRFIAYHFYGFAGSDRSAVRLGLELGADLERHDGPAYALRFVEEFLLPLALSSGKAIDLRLQVRALHARLLIVAGDVDRGVAQASRLRAYGDMRTLSKMEATARIDDSDGDCLST